MANAPAGGDCPLQPVVLLVEWKKLEEQYQRLLTPFLQLIQGAQDFCHTFSAPSRASHISLAPELIPLETPDFFLRGLASQSRQLTQRVERMTAAPTLKTLASICKLLAHKAAPACEKFLQFWDWYGMALEHWDRNDATFHHREQKIVRALKSERVVLSSVLHLAKQFVEFTKARGDFKQTNILGESLLHIRDAPSFLENFYWLSVVRAVSLYHVARALDKYCPYSASPSPSAWKNVGEALHDYDTRVEHLQQICATLPREIAEQLMRSHRRLLCTDRIIWTLADQSKECLMHMCSDVLVICPEHGRPEQAFIVPITPSMHLREDASTRRVNLSSLYGWRVGEWIFQVPGQVLPWMSHFLETQRFVVMRDDAMSIYHSHSLFEVKQLLRDIKLDRESQRLDLALPRTLSGSPSQRVTSIISELDVSPSIPTMKVLYHTRPRNTPTARSWQRATGERQSSADVLPRGPKRPPKLIRSGPLLGARSHSPTESSSDYFCSSEGQVASPMNFRRLLQVPTLLEALRGVMVQQHCQENLTFLEAIDRFRLLLKSQMGAMADKIYEQYLHPDAPDLIGIDSRPLIHKRIQAGDVDATLFDQAYQDVTELIVNGVLIRFFRSDEFQAWKSAQDPLKEKNTLRPKPSTKSSSKPSSPLSSRNTSPERTAPKKRKGKEKAPSAPSPDPNRVWVMQDSSHMVNKKNLLLLLADPPGKALFLAYTQRKLCDENIHFLDAVEAFQLAPTEEDALQRAQQIVSTFVEQSGAMPVNLDGKRVTQIKQQLPSQIPVDRELFTGARADILMVLTTDTLRQFIRAPEFEQYKQMVEDSLHPKPKRGIKGVMAILPWKIKESTVANTSQPHLSAVSPRAEVLSASPQDDSVLDVSMTAKERHLCRRSSSCSDLRAFLQSQPPARPPPRT